MKDKQRKQKFYGNMMSHFYGSFGLKSNGNFAHSKLNLRFLKTCLIKKIQIQCRQKVYMHIHVLDQN